MKDVKLIVLTLLFFSSCIVQKQGIAVKDNDVERIIKTLSADDMQGRATFSAGIDRAASFIEKEFKEIGLQPLKGQQGFRQSFAMSRIKPSLIEVTVEGNPVAPENVMVVTDLPGLSWNSNPEVQVIQIKGGETFVNRYREIIALNKPVMVYVDKQYADAFTRLRARSLQGHVVNEPNNQAAVVFVLADESAKSFRVNFTNNIEKLPLFNVAGMLPGKSKAAELVVFSGHYDHLGIIKPVAGDSIANGADDDASGITAVISLARHFKKTGNNERTLIFVAFTAEEIGGFGSRYFSTHVNPDSVTAMFNIEMIGKESKFGQNAAFITGYERSDFGQILQKNLEDTEFKFHPDPYPQENLFYRSDNATLAALGVPAHTISTDKIDTDKFYHTVNDEFETLNVNNIIATIRAIALSSRTIVAGTDTPARIPKLKTGN